MYECSILIWQKSTLKKRGEIDAIPDNAYKHLALCFVITDSDFYCLTVLSFQLLICTNVLYFTNHLVGNNTEVVGKVFSGIKQARLMDICNSISLYFITVILVFQCPIFKEFSN